MLQHFEGSQFMNLATQNKLVWNAVPTLFDFPDSPTTYTCRKRKLPTVATSASCSRADLQGRQASYLYNNAASVHQHFEGSQFMNLATRNKLVWNAVPTLFDFPDSPTTYTCRKRKLPTVATSASLPDVPSKEQLCSTESVTEYASEQPGKCRKDDKYPVVVIAPVKMKTELDGDSKPCVKHHPVNKADVPLSTSPWSTDVPYLVDIFERKLKASVNGSTMECASDSDKRHAFTPRQIKQENQDPKEVGQDRVMKTNYADTDDDKDNIMSRITIKNEPDVVEQCFVKQEDMTSCFPIKYENTEQHANEQHDKIVVTSSSITGADIRM